MPKIEVFKYDSCGNIVVDLKDVYRIKGESWFPPDARKGNIDLMQNIKDFGLCESCATDIKGSLEKIAESRT